MKATSREFTANARAGLANPNLQQALQIMTRSGFPLRRREVVARLPEFEALRDVGRDIKEHTLAHLDFYLELYEQNVVASGGEVHWARTPEEAREAVLNICRGVGAKTVTKGKSMIAEEIGLNDFLEKSGITPVETDLGEYIIQLRHEPPSHLIAPAMHLVKGQVADTFRGAHHALDPNRSLGEARELCDEARALLRPQFLAADVGITGANFLIAETGSSIIVTNEGNGDLTQTFHAYTSSWPALKSWCRHSRTRQPSCGCWRARPPGRSFRPIRRCRPVRAAPVISTGRRRITSCCSTMAAAICWAASFTRCCVASAAAPA